MKSRRQFLQLSAAVAPVLALSKSALARGVTAADQAQNAAVRAAELSRLRARPVPLGNVRLTGGPLKKAQELTAAYLLSLEPDRMLAFYRVRAGLEQKAQPYSGWDGSGRQLTGHIAGHHLSAVSLMYQATGDAHFKERADYLVKELKEVQDKRGDGYLGAIITADNTDAHEIFARVSKGDIRSGGFDLNGLWSPWYTLHKTFAGLRDAYRHTGNRMALDVELKFAGWAESILAPMTDAQVQKMLLTEHGGMNEILVDLYADTGDKRWLNLSLRFEHHAFTDALKRHQDNLDGKHGNCNIPKLIGSAARYGYTGDPADIMAASFFWDRVVQHHSYATGGHGLAEYWGPPDQLSPRVDGRTCETCNVYNMIKLTRRLFSIRPDVFYADFQERALFNHILASIDNEDGRTSYMVPVGRGVSQEYQNMLQSFTCCVGSGMESHALHGDGLYYESDDTIWANLYVPSTATFANGVNLKMDSSFPDGDSATMTLTMPASKTFTLAVRRPFWAGDGFVIKLNGTALEQPKMDTFLARGSGGRNAPTNDPVPVSTYVEINRAWKSGDVVELTLPKSLRLEPTPDNKTVSAITWGPLVLAGDHGPRATGGRQANAGTAGGAAGATAAAPTAPPVIPMLVAGDRPLNDWVSANPARQGDFVAKQVGRVVTNPSVAPLDVALTPFYRTHRRTYSIYFDLLTPADFDARVKARDAEIERRKRIEAATVAFIQPGDAQAEKEFNYQSDQPNRQAPRTNGRSNRGGTGWFSYDLMVEPTMELSLLVTYFNELGLPPSAGDFDIIVEGTSIAHFQSNATATGFYDASYPIPIALTRGKARATVKFQATGTNGRIAPVFGVRIIRGTA
jgi:DUF1680 family protein